MTDWIEPKKLVITKTAIDLCLESEGFHKAYDNGQRCTAYPDPGPSGLPITIGWGTVNYPETSRAYQRHNRATVRMGDSLLRDDARECFDIEVTRRAELIRERLTRPITQGMFDALISFYYNLWVDSYPQQIQRINAGKFEEAARKFDEYNSADGKVLPGLVIRRNKEEALFRKEAWTGPVIKNPPRASNLSPYAPLALPWNRTDKSITQGDQGEDVAELHCALIALGSRYMPMSDNKMVGDVATEHTTWGVRLLQKDHGLLDDGIVGHETADLIQYLLARARGAKVGNTLAVPYFYQYANRNEPSATCGLTSAAMLLRYFGHDVTPDSLYAKFGKQRGQSPGGLAGIYKAFKHKSESGYNGTIETIKSHIDGGRPVVVHGWFTRSGHIMCCVGYDAKGLIFNDPSGMWSRVNRGGYPNRNATNGRNVHYTYAQLANVIGRIDGLGKGNDAEIWYSVAWAT